VKVEVEMSTYNVDLEFGVGEWETKAAHEVMIHE